MNTIIYIILIVIIVRSLTSYLKKKNEVPQNANFSPKDSPLKRILANYGDFSADIIIESPFDFYLFSVDELKKDFIFITEVKAVYRLSYDNLKSYSIRKKEGAEIRLDLITTFEKKPIITIICFDATTALAKLSGSQRSAVSTSQLYEEELENIELIEEVFSEILEERISESEDVPPPYVESSTQPMIEEEAVVTPLVEPSKETAHVIEVIPEKIDLSETKVIDAPNSEKACELDKPDSDSIIFANTDIVDPELDFVDVKPEKTEEVVESDIAEGNVCVSLEDVEEYSRGKFLESAVQSAFSDARLHGKKYIVITEEQFENLKK